MRITKVAPIAISIAILIFPSCSNKKAAPRPVADVQPSVGPPPPPVAVPESITIAADVRATPTAEEVQVELPLAAPAAAGGAWTRAQMRANGTYAYKDTSFLPPQDREHNTEEYGRFEENPFLRPAENPLSTFSIDVDRASYANVRRFLASGQKPPRDAVRIEEMVNYFTYDYAEPEGREPFSITTELSACPWNSRHKLMLVGLQGKRMKTRDLPPNNLVFLIDTSGSMQEPDKLPLVRQGLRLLVEQMRPIDRISIVAYAGSAGLVLPSTTGSEKGRILAAIDDLQAGGSTAGAEGIVLAYDVAKKNFSREGNNRVILATDGDFNVGVTSDGELERLIEQKRRDNIFLTVLGFGTGNIKDSKMELLADKGNGNYAYIDSLNEARKTLVHEMGGTLFTIAKDVKIQVEFNPAVVGAYRLIGYENRVMRSEDFNNDKKDAGELGAGHSVTALYEIAPPGEALAGGVDPLKYQNNTPRGTSGELATIKLRYKHPDADTSQLLSRVVSNSASPVMSDNLRLASAVAELGMLLRNSEHKGDATYEEAARLAQSVRRDVGDLMELVRQAKAL
ncbi:MAG: VWA domain-containing protein [Acidobacteriota bacterium]|nr:VWA domain-containing protein [Acidobacteriota bacterium]